MTGFVLCRLLKIIITEVIPKLNNSKEKYVYRPRSVLFYYSDFNIAKSEINLTF